MCTEPFAPSRSLHVSLQLDKICIAVCGALTCGGPPRPGMGIPLPGICPLWSRGPGGGPLPGGNLPLPGGGHPGERPGDLPLFPFHAGLQQGHLSKLAEHHTVTSRWEQGCVRDGDLHMALLTKSTCLSSQLAPCTCYPAVLKSCSCQVLLMC